MPRLLALGIGLYRIAVSEAAIGGCDHLVAASQHRSKLVSNSDARIVLAAFVVLLVLSGLDAYDLGQVPLQWIMQVAAIGAVGYVALKHRLRNPLGYRSLWLFCLWSVLVTAVGAVAGEYSVLVPAGATTPYPLFLALRIATQLSFIGSLYLIYWLVLQGQRDQIIKTTVWVGVAVSIVAIYIYFAQLYGLPEPPRSRLGTSGGLQAVRFTYDFHRATGTFREPSLLAAWLIVPLFLCFTIRARAPFVLAIVMGGTILLTGSLSGILAIVFGLGVAGVTGLASNRQMLGSRKAAQTSLVLNRRFILGITRGLVALLSALAIFYLLAVSNTGHGVNLFGTLGNRIEPILRGGLGSSDRYLVYGYVAQTGPSFFGTGLGNANLLLSHYLHTNVVASFISLYLNAIYATGFVGIALLVWFLLSPLYRLATNAALRSDSRVLLIGGAYLAWLIAFGVSMEEFTLMFALVCALLSFELHDSGQETRDQEIRLPLTE